jgi:hypothetical protein
MASRGAKVTPIIVTAAEKGAVMRSIDNAVGGLVVEKDQFCGTGVGIEINPQKQSIALYYKAVAEELYQVQD